ncbi:hypothetical protein [Solidesulfovibrio carbinolicus]|uniref:hypothetical protein n=1 Tax=Solidesulfovibrio carbinolicus TaxID=296842 RepID=UPI0010114E10|nr:hypothetical protein [Solidesulfovibrio carbinolicus]
MELQFGMKFEELQFTPPILSLSGYDFCDSMLSACYLLSTMCFPSPESERLRKKSTALLYASMVSESNTSDVFAQMHSKVDANFIEALISPPPIDIDGLFRSMKESQKEGLIAGEILHKIYCMNKANVIQPSYNKARAFIQHDAEKNNLQISHSNSTIDRIWSKYKNVSHLWTAMQYLEPHKYVDGPPPITALVGEENIVTLLSIAEHFRLFGENYVTHNTNANSQRPMFETGEAWRPAPCFPLLHLDWEAWGEGQKIIPDLTEKLKHFKNRRKRLK